MEVFFVINNHGLDRMIEAVYDNYTCAEDHATILEMRGYDVEVCTSDVLSSIPSTVDSDPTMGFVRDISKLIAEKAREEMPLIDWTSFHNRTTIIEMISQRVGEELNK